MLTLRILLSRAYVCPPLSLPHTPPTLQLKKAKKTVTTKKPAAAPVAGAAPVKVVQATIAEAKAKVRVVGG